MLEITELGDGPVVTRKDPDWLKWQFGSLSSAIDLSHGRFPYFAEWPEVNLGRKLIVVRFKDETLPNWAAVDERLTVEGYGPECRTFPFDLAYFVVPQVDEQWRKYRRGWGPAWVYVSDGKSLWTDDDGNLFLPCVGMGSGYCRVHARKVEAPFSDYGGFLVSRE